MITVAESHRRGAILVRGRLPMGSGDVRDPIDPAIADFVTANVVSFAAWDLLLRLHHDPELCVTPAELAVAVSRRETEMLPVISSLAASGVLQREERAGRTCYRLTDDPESRRLVAGFASMGDHRAHRIEFVRQVLARVTGS